MDYDTERLIDELKATIKELRAELERLRDIVSVADAESIDRVLGERSE